MPGLELGVFDLLFVPSFELFEIRDDEELEVNAIFFPCPNC